ncbi:MAG: NPCBM/NEW2 domain-containing protein [Fimbriiglobus sp.]
MTLRTRFGSALAFAALAATAAPADQLVTLAGRKIDGTVTAVDPQFVTFTEKATGTAAKVPVKEVAVVDLKNPAVVLTDATKRDEIELTDGSVIVCTKLLLKGKAAEPALLPAPGAEPPAVNLPLGHLSGVLRGADDPKARAEWKKLLAARGKRDLFVIRQAEGLNPLPGTVLEGTEAGDAVVFEREDGTKSTLKLARATGGLVFNQPPRDVIPPTVCKVRDVFGNVLLARSVEFAGSGIKVKTVSGATFDYPSAKGVAKLDFAEGNVAYLSDLSPVVAAPDAVPGEPHFTFLKDRTPDGPPLRLDGTAYPKGLWVAPDTALTFPLNGDYREFKAVVGVDERVPVASAAVKLTIEADGRVLFTGVVGRKDKPKPLTLDVKDVKELKVVAEPDGLYLGGHLTLADARVQK